MAAKTMTAPDLAPAPPLPRQYLEARPQPAAAGHPADLLILSSIEFLSNILFAVILLEVLHTTVIFLHDRSSRAIVRAFLVVAILSVVRKMMLVGGLVLISRIRRSSP